MMQRFPDVVWLFFASFAAISLPCRAISADLTGEQIYVQHCASCHGRDGEGVEDEYSDPLVGERSLANLTRYVEKWMPEEKPKSIVGEDAKKVSQYVFDTFYSPQAQVKRNPPRVELSRLTSRQYRNAVADLLGSFTNQGDDGNKHGDKRGLHAEFFSGGRRFNDRRAVLDRFDEKVDFNFGEQGPSDKVGKDEYAARWSGSIFAPETGEYEFIVETDNGTRLWVNEYDALDPQLDMWVRSGNDRRHSTSVFLLGGRSYRIQLEIFKEKREKVSSATLKWKPPHGAEEVIPSRVLSPNRVAKAFVLSTPLPPDDRSMGYVRGTMVSKAWDEATTYAALEAADTVIRYRELFTGRASSDAELKDRARFFARQFVERAFRRPLTDDQAKFFVDRQFENSPDLETALKKVVLLALKSPRFLYHEVGTKKTDAYDIASRISFGLWDSLPDEKLLAAARAGRLDTREGIVAEVNRMMADPRTKAKMREFFHTWLNLDRLHELAKDSKQYQDLNEHVMANMRV